MTELARLESVTKPEDSAPAVSARRRTPLSTLRTIFREPLVQFLVLGALLFLFFEWRGGSASPASNKIVITRGQIEHLAAGFTRGWQREPTEAELKGLIDEYVKEEIANREAVAMGLDRDDTIIRRRLRQKLEFLVEDGASSAPPTDAELQAWLAKNPESFRAEPKIAFRQVYLSPEQHRDALRDDAVRLLARLRAARPEAALGLGDPSLLPSEQGLAPLNETSRVFGDEFARQLLTLEPGQWTGPVESSFGLHLVLLREKVVPSQLQLSDIRPHVERELLAERRKEQLQALYDRLLQKYSVQVERQAPAR